MQLRTASRALGHKSFAHAEDSGRMMFHSQEYIFTTAAPQLCHSVSANKMSPKEETSSDKNICCTHINIIMGLQFHFGSVVIVHKANPLREEFSKGGQRNGVS